MADPSRKTIHLPKAMDHQIDVLLSPARFKVVAAGRRWGKTAMGLMMTVKGHGPKRGVLRGAMDGATIGWVAPTYGITDTVIWPDLKRACAPAAIRVSEKEHKITLPGGGSIKVMSADQPENLRGAGWDGMVLDEAAFIDEGAWREVLRPALADRQGWAVFISTPNGFNWFYKRFEEAGYTPGWERWQRPTSENHIIPASEIDASRVEMGPRAFAQEMGASFLSMEGAFFDGAYFGDHIWFTDWPAEGVVHRVMALDPSLGKTDKADYSAMILMARTNDNKLFVDASIERRDVIQTIDDSIRLARGFDPLGFAIETNQFQELMADELRRRALSERYALPVYKYNNTLPKKTRIRSLNPYLSAGEIKFKRGSRGATLLVDQLIAFGLPSINDDGPDALEMAIRLSERLNQGIEDEVQERVSA